MNQAHRDLWRSALAPDPATCTAAQAAEYLAEQLADLAAAMRRVARLTGELQQRKAGQ